MGWYIFKNNFPASNRPSTDGAYIVQNSWGKDWGTNGKFYVSYEDLYIEDGLTGIEGVTEYKDTSEPEITVKDVGSGKLKINVTDKYSSGVNGSSLKYKWTDHNIEPNTKDSSWTSIKMGIQLEVKMTNTYGYIVKTKLVIMNYTVLEAVQLVYWLAILKHNVMFG